MFYFLLFSRIRACSLKEKVLFSRSVSDPLEARLGFICRLSRPWYHTLLVQEAPDCSGLCPLDSGSGYVLSLNVPVLDSFSISGFSGETWGQS